MNKNIIFLGVISIGAVLTLSGVLGYQLGSSKNFTVKKEASSSANITPLPNPTNTPEPFINCNNPDCGSIVIPKSQCSDSEGFVCCFLQDGKKWYSSREACKTDQEFQKNQ